jgi:hypothetical protein
VADKTKDTRTPLLQSITTVPAVDSNAEPQAIDISFCREVSFVETLDLSGPRLILKFDDSLSILRNIMKIKTGDVLCCALADLLAKKEMDYTANFTIMSMPVNGEVVTLNCLLKEIADMKTPAVKPQMFATDKDLKTTISALTHIDSPATAPPMKINFPGLIATQNSYHLLPGERPTMLLRQMAIEHGAAVFVSRGVINFVKLSTLSSAPVKTCFHFKNPLASYQILDYTHINRDDLVSDRLVRKFSGFSETDPKGFIYSTKNTGAAVEITAHDNLAIINNLSTMPVPILDIMTSGAGHLMPGIKLKIQWNTDESYGDSFLDESLPTQAIVGSVAHYSAGASNYFCRVKLVKVVGE